ncbi:methyltransferase, FkbM family [Duganella sp. CF402]|uniref:FkbM family methyltransferase n=1 Tax=unclassified Duganella TaxID=2636909 RepID=UPI0008ACDA95|nr:MULTISPECIES: FkbM family methyltransferase [unclassified Duganella]RZT04531.1 FkbM family methyltransferase [Duganella sp. BK701]SEM33139.1 methyltransferase, FkbM family [Duganella sp. CF402]
METRETAVHIGGTVCSMSSDDDYLSHIGNNFEPHMVALFTCLAGNKRVVLDIGANIGCTAILFSSLYEQVHAFEPSPSTFRYLQANVARNAGPNVTVHNFGIGAEAGSSTITFAANNRSGAFVSNHEKANADHLSEHIEIRTLDDTVDALGLTTLDFIKIDVEGFEGHVLRGGQATLARFRPLLVLELNHWCLNAFQRTSVPEFFDQLRATFPLLYAVDGNGYLNLHSLDESYAVMYHHILHLRFSNIVCAYDEVQLAGFFAQYRHGMGGQPDAPEHTDDTRPAAAPAPDVPPPILVHRSLMGRALRRVHALMGRG